MSHRLTSAIKKDDQEVPIVKVRPGVFALREWGDGKGKKGAAARAEADAAAAAGSDAGVEVNALEIEVLGAQRLGQVGSSRGRGRRRASERPGRGRRRRAGHAGVRRGGPAGRPRGPWRRAVRRRGRRRPAHPGSSRSARSGRPAGAGRRAGRKGGSQAPAATAPRSRRQLAARTGPGSAVASSASQPRLEGSERTGERGERVHPPDRPARPSATRSRGSPAKHGRGANLSPERRTRVPSSGTATRSWRAACPRASTCPSARARSWRGETSPTPQPSSSRRLDRGSGPPPIRVIAEALMRRGRLQGDPAVAVRPLDQRRAASRQPSPFGQRPTSALPLCTAATSRSPEVVSEGGESWAARAEDVLSAIERPPARLSPRDGLRRLQELPGHAPRGGLHTLPRAQRAGRNERGRKPVRRAGSPGGEGSLRRRPQDRERRDPHRDRQGAGAIGGEEIGRRERVTDLRGALHHYGPASTGWLPVRRRGRSLLGRARRSGGSGRTARGALRRDRPLQAGSRISTWAWSRRGSPSPSPTWSCSRPSAPEQSLTRSPEAAPMHRVVTRLVSRLVLAAGLWPAFAGAAQQPDAGVAPPPAPEVKLSLTAPTTRGTWKLRVTNDGDVPVRIVADARDARARRHPRGALAHPSAASYLPTTCATPRGRPRAAARRTARQVVLGVVRGAPVLLRRGQGRGARAGGDRRRSPRGGPENTPRSFEVLPIEGGVEPRVAPVAGALEAPPVVSARRAHGRWPSSRPSGGPGDAADADQGAPRARPRRRPRCPRPRAAGPTSSRSAASRYP